MSPLLPAAAIAAVASIGYLATMYPDEASRVLAALGRRAWTWLTVLPRLVTANPGHHGAPRRALADQPVPYWPACLTPAPRGAVRAGQAEDAGGPPTPAAAALPPAPEDAAAQLPRPVNSPGPGQPPASWVVFPDQRAWAAHRRRIDGLAAPGPCRETGGMPALVGGHYGAFEAWRDQPARMVTW